MENKDEADPGELSGYTVSRQCKRKRAVKLAEESEILYPPLSSFDDVPDDLI